VQECLTNVVRHARANLANISVRQSLVQQKKWVVIQVSDDGIGGSSSGEGFGVLAMRERVESMGGLFMFESSPDDGVTVTARMPFIEK